MKCKTCNKELPTYAYMCKIEYCSEDCKNGKKNFENIEDLFGGIFNKKCN